MHVNPKRANNKRKKAHIHRLMRSGRSFFLNYVLHRKCYVCNVLLSSSWYILLSLTSLFSPKNFFLFYNFSFVFPSSLFGCPVEIFPSTLTQPRSSARLTHSHWTHYTNVKATCSYAKFFQRKPKRKY